MTEAFNQGANVWMAYDWVYPPRQGGEALIHVDWGNDYKKTKIYDGFRQWCAPLSPGMHVVVSTISGPAASGIAQPGVKAAAFLSADGKHLVAHVANVSDQAAEFKIDPGAQFSNAVGHCARTSADESMSELPDNASDATVTLPPRSMNTWEYSLK